MTPTAVSQSWLKGGDGRARVDFRAAMVGVVFAAIFLLSLALDTRPSDAFLTLFVLPIVLSAAAFGWKGVAAAVAGAVVLLIVWLYVTGASLSSQGLFARTALYVLTGALTVALVAPRQAAKLLRTKLTSAEALLGAVVSTLDAYAVVSLDAQGRITAWNAGAARMFGYSAPEAVGQTLARAYPPDAEAPDDVLRRAAADGVTRADGWRVRADGSRFWARTTIVALRDDGGELTGFAKVTYDATAEREAELRLQNARRLLGEAERLAAMGSWEWDASTNTTVDQSENLPMVLGFPPGTHAHFDRVLEAMPAEDADALLGAAERCVHAGESYDIVCRMHSGSRRRLVRIRGARVAGMDGRLVGTARDVTDEQVAAAVFQTAQEAVVDIESRLGLAVLDLRPDARQGVAQVNTAFVRLSGLAGDRVHSTDDLRGALKRSSPEPDELGRLLRGEAAEYRATHVFEGREGRQRVLVRGLLLDQPDGGPTLALVELEQEAGAHVQSSAANGNLTEKELEVLRLVAEGCSGPAIAEQLFISRETVKSRLASAYGKLGAPDRAAAVASAIRQGLI